MKRSGIPLERPELGMVNTVSQTIRAEEWRTPELFTSVRLGPSLVIATDYGGEHQSACYRSFSFVVADMQFLWYWNERREEIRKTILKDSRRLSYKRLTEACRARAGAFLASHQHDSRSSGDLFD